MNKYTKININNITFIEVNDKIESKAIIHYNYNKSFWEGTVEEGFYREGFDSSLISPDKYKDYPKYIFDETAKKAFYKPSLNMYLSDGNVLTEYFNLYNDAVQRMKNITRNNNINKFIEYVKFR